MTNDIDLLLLSQQWYAKPDDLVGGWCVTNCDKTPSQIDVRKGEYVVGDFLTERMAKEVVAGHQYLMEKWDADGPLDVPRD